MILINEEIRRRDLKTDFMEASVVLVQGNYMQFQNKSAANLNCKKIRACRSVAFTKWCQLETIAKGSTKVDPLITFIYRLEEQPVHSTSWQDPER